MSVLGDSQGEEAPIIRALLSVPDGFSFVSGTQGALNTDANAPFEWAHTGESATCVDASTCVAVDAFEFFTFASLPITLTPSTMSTFVFQAVGGSSPGGGVFSASGDGAGFFSFEGTADSPNVSIVPEPTTAALLGLGLLSLAINGRRR